MTPEQYIEEKKKQIDELHQEQEKLCNIIENVAKLPYKDFSTALKRAGEMIELAAQVKRLQFEKAIIASKPFPKYKKGKGGQLAVVGESDKPEMVVSVNGEIKLPETKNDLRMLPNGAKVFPYNDELMDRQQFERDIEIQKQSAFPLSKEEEAAKRAIFNARMEAKRK